MREFLPSATTVDIVRQSIATKQRRRIIWLFFYRGLIFLVRVFIVATEFPLSITVPVGRIDVRRYRLSIFYCGSFYRRRQRYHMIVVVVVVVFSLMMMMMMNV